MMRWIGGELTAPRLRCLLSSLTNGRAATTFRQLPVLPGLRAFASRGVGLMTTTSPTADHFVPAGELPIEGPTRKRDK